MALIPVQYNVTCSAVIGVSEESSGVASSAIVDLTCMAVASKSSIQDGVFSEATGSGGSILTALLLGVTSRYLR